MINRIVSFNFIFIFALKINFIMNIYCPLHNNQIIQIDVDINTPLGERAVCIECPSKSRENISRIV